MVIFCFKIWTGKYNFLQLTVELYCLKCDNVVLPNWVLLLIPCNFGLLFIYTVQICSLCRCIITLSHRGWSLSEDTILVKFLLDVIGSTHGVSCRIPQSICQEKSAEINFRFSPEISLSELQTVAFEMLSEAISRAGSSFPVDIWRSMLEVYNTSAFFFFLLC